MWSYFRAFLVVVLDTRTCGFGIYKLPCPSPYKAYTCQTHTSHTHTHTLHTHTHTGTHINSIVWQIAFLEGDFNQSRSSSKQRKRQRERELRKESERKCEAARLSE